MAEMYNGDRYWDYPEVEAWCRALAAEEDWISLETIGVTREGRSILLLTLGENPSTTPAMWLDAGTHASEFTGVMSVVFSLSRWVEWARGALGKQWFKQHTIFVCPCVSPDGFQALHDGHAFLRSSTRPPKSGALRSGLEPQDINGDGKVRLMRWKDPAGPYVYDDECSLGLRLRRLHDSAEDACFVASEGLFVEWDGVRWTQAPLKHGLDLNRNFPVHWGSFEMFGMDGGEFSLSEPESRSVMEAVTQRKNIAVALTNHTYTGALLTQPYRKDTPLAESDIDLMEKLAIEGVRGTNYRVFRVCPEFTYDPNQPIVGVWADCLSTTLGIPGYTLELWDPFDWAGVKVKEPAKFFKHPQPAIIEALLRKAVQQRSGPIMWSEFQHPQLGSVELGGIDYLRTIRNPPEELLRAECERGHTVADNLCRALPELHLEVVVEAIGIETYRVQARFENRGFLSTTSTKRALSIGAASGLQVSLEATRCVSVLEGSRRQDLGPLEGWGDWQVASAKNLIYPSLPAVGHRAAALWIVQGFGDVVIHWDSGRAGSGSRTVLINENPDSPQLRLY